MPLIDDDEVFALIKADRADRGALIAALKAALPHLAHQPECMVLSPTAEWERHGSWNANNCHCVIAEIKAALNGR